MNYELLLAVATLVSLVLYALGAGADFGGGMWDLLARGPRARAQRETIAKALAPIWEANHVWLILVLVVLFTGFPRSFAVIMTALHIPMTLILVGIVLRGSAFVFRSYDRQDGATHRRWSTVFGQASFATPFLLGDCLGALASGEIRVVDGAVASGFFAGWTQPFALACGLFAQGLFALLAAVFLTVETKTQPELQEDFRRRALVSCLLLLPASLLVFLLARHGAPEIFHGLTQWWAPWMLAVTSGAALTVLGALRLRKFRTARAAVVVQVTSILVGWGLAQFPHIVVPDVTFANSAAPEATQRYLVLALAVGALLLLPSFLWLFAVFKGRNNSSGPKTPADG